MPLGSRFCGACGHDHAPSDAFSPTTTISTQIVMDMQNARPQTPASDVLFAMSMVLLAVAVTVVLITRFVGRGQRTS